MYLLEMLFRYIFVTVKFIITTLDIKIVIPLKSFIPFLVCWLLASVQINAQQVWPGDVNDDGIVNNVDVIYWVYAKDAAGPPRADADSSWVAQALPDSLLWSESFPNGLNFAYADCNGDGIIDHLDRDIIGEHHWFKRDSVIFDNYDEGIPGVDAPFCLTPLDTIASEGEQEVLTLSLGSDSIQVDSMIGIAFTLKFSPDQIKDIGENRGFEFSFLTDSWFCGNEDEKAEKYIVVDRDSGLVSVAIYRENALFPAMGSGGFAQFTVIFEELVLSIVKIEIDSAIVFDDSLGLRYLVSTGATLHNADSLNTQQNQPEDDGALDNVFDYDNNLNLYPNPSSGFILMEMLEGGQQQIEGVKVYSVEGTEMMEMEMEEPTNQTQLQMNEYEPGLYFIKVRTQDGYIIKRMILSPDDTSTGQF